MKKFVGAMFTLTLVAACGVNQRLDNALLISPGMTKEKVIAIMGAKPVKTEFSGAVEEWHYCKTGRRADQFVAVFFTEGRAVAMRPYTVTLSDAKGATGSCEIFVKMGNYREPAEVRELRVNVY